MQDHSHLDSKYFITHDIYNCPYCNRRHVKYRNLGSEGFHWTSDKICYIWRVICESCQHISMHLTFSNLQDSSYGFGRFKDDVDLDQEFFYSVPTSFFVVDNRIPKEIRELISEAEGCAKMNYLTGASACTRKGIYELLALQRVEGANYDDKIESLRKKYLFIDPVLFEILGHIKDMTSDHVHEQSWIAWDSRNLQLFLETFKAILHEIYVIPDEKLKRTQSIRDLKEKLGKAKNVGVPTKKTASE